MFAQIEMPVAGAAARRSHKHRHSSEKMAQRFDAEFSEELSTEPPLIRQLVELNLHAPHANHSSNAFQLVKSRRR
jgi:hypothetical protein